MKHDNQSYLCRPDAYLQTKFWCQNKFICMLKIERLFSLVSTRNINTGIPDMSSLRLLRLTCKHCASTAACWIADSGIFALGPVLLSLAELLPSCTSLGVLSMSQNSSLSTGTELLAFFKAALSFRATVGSVACPSSDPDLLVFATSTIWDFASTYRKGRLSSFFKNGSSRYVIEPKE